MQGWSAWQQLRLPPSIQTPMSATSIVTHLKLILIERDYPIEFLMRISKQLMNNLRCMIDDNLPYKILREEIEKQYFDPINSAKRFERSLNQASSSLPGGIGAGESTE
jgi:hypothetical protein